MAAATSSITQSPTIRITTAAHVLAQIQARRAVKEQLRHEDVKVSHLAASEISALARSYLIAGFRSLADAWADTTTAHGRLMLTVPGGLAEFERELIRARTDEGRKRA